jgi:hypothetical protein
MLAMSRSPASAGASSSTRVAAGSSAAAVTAGSVLLSTTGACGLTTASRPLCQSRHKFLYGGGWAAASFSRLSHCLPVAFVPLIHRVGRRNLLQALGIQLSAYTTLQDKYSTTLLKEFTS